MKFARIRDALHVSVSGYYRWRSAEPSARALRRSALLMEVRVEHERSLDFPVLHGCCDIHSLGSRQRKPLETARRVRT